MRLITAHKIMISSAIAFGIFFTGWSGHRYSGGRESMDLNLALVSGVATLSLVFYFRYFLKKNRKDKV